MKATKPKERFSSEESQKYIAKLLGVIYDNSSQDWEIEIAQSSELSKYIDLYKILRNEDDKFVLMQIILQAMEEATERIDEMLPEIESILDNDFAIHEYSVHYWCMFDSEINDSFRIRNIMRDVFRRNINNAP